MDYEQRAEVINVSNVIILLGFYKPVGMMIPMFE